MSGNRSTHCRSAPQIGYQPGTGTWSEAGRTIEMAHRTKLPVGLTSWAALVLAPVVTVCLFAL